MLKMGATLFKALLQKNEIEFTLPEKPGRCLQKHHLAGDKKKRD